MSIIIEGRFDEQSTTGLDNPLVVERESNLNEIYNKIDDSFHKKLTEYNISGRLVQDNQGCVHAYENYGLRVTRRVGDKNADSNILYITPRGSIHGVVVFTDAKSGKSHSVEQHVANHWDSPVNYISRHMEYHNDVTNELIEVVIIPTNEVIK